MRLSGVSFRVGKRSRIYFSNNKKSKKKSTARASSRSEASTSGGSGGPLFRRKWVCILFLVLSCALLLVMLLALLLGIVGFKQKTGFFFSLIFCAVGFFGGDFSLAFVISCVDELKALNLKSEPEAENRSGAADGQPLPDKPGKFVFVLEGLEDEEGQRFLHDLKIRRTAEGIRGQFRLQDEDGVFSVLLDGQLLGHPGKADSAWLSENFSRFIGVEDLRVYGGGTDRDGQPRPFVVKIWAKLTPGPDGPKLSDVFLKPPLLNGYTCKGDQVVYVSSTGKIHTGNCNVGLSGCTPMLYEEALDQGFVECGNCFR